MYCVMDRIKVSSFGTFSQVEFTSSSTVLSFYTHLKVFLCAVSNDFTEKFCEFSSMLSFFVSSFLPVETDFRIAFSVGNSCHCQIHTNFRALTLEVSSQVFKNVFAHTLSNTNNVFSSPCHLALLLCEFGSRSLTLRTDFRSSVTFVNISTYITYPFCHNFDLLFLIKLVLFNNSNNSQ